MKYRIIVKFGTRAQAQECMNRIEGLVCDLDATVCLYSFSHYVTCITFDPGHFALNFYAEGFTEGMNILCEDEQK